MIRCDSEADSIVWIEEGHKTLTSLIRRIPENDSCFRVLFS